MNSKNCYEKEKDKKKGDIQSKLWGKVLLTMENGSKEMSYVIRISFSMWLNVT